MIREVFRGLPFLFWRLMEQTLNLTLKESSLYYFFPLFQQGVIIKTLVGGNIKGPALSSVGNTSRLPGKQDSNHLSGRESG